MLADLGMKLIASLAAKTNTTTRAYSMAHAGRNTGGSQFFIVLSRAHTAHLDGNHTCFGKVVEGVDTIEDLRQGDMFSVEIRVISKVEGYIEKAREDFIPILEKLRDILLKDEFQLEGWKWNAPNYNHKGMVCWLAHFKNHVGLNF